jgi:hypothetical protein
MLLCRARLVALLPFEDVTLPFCDEEGRPRPFTVIHGGAGVGKTTVLGAIAATRPGYAVVPPGRAPASAGRAGEEPSPSHAVCDWATGQDDPQRPHTLCIATPTVRLWSDDQEEALRRREQALYDKRAREAGYVFVALPSTRWFSRQPIGISAPAQTLARYDVRAAITFDDASRADLGRETKQALAYAEIVGALSSTNAVPELADSEANGALLGRAMREAVNRLVALAGYAYRGLHTPSLEPVFSEAGGRLLAFDALPNRVRHLVSFAALPVRALWAAYRGRDPLAGEAVVAIDEVDLHQDPAHHSSLVQALRAALPAVQWVVTSSASAIAGSCDTKDVLALRRLPERDRIELFVGSEARTH